MHKCVCVFVWVSVSVWMSVCVYVHVCVCMCVCVASVCVCTYMYLKMSAIVRVKYVGAEGGLHVLQKQRKDCIVHCAYCSIVSPLIF